MPRKAEHHQSGSAITGVSPKKAFDEPEDIGEPGA
jgi:hypothetical protein